MSKFMQKILYFVVLFLFLESFVFAAENRYALVIGNGNYKDESITNLKNPANDAEDIAFVLSKLGYEVIFRTDIGLRDMLNAVRTLTNELTQNPESEGFFWFAGHGLSIKEKHYMLPVDVDPYDDESLIRSAFSVDDLMEGIEAAKNQTNLIVIDACRNSVLPGSRSLGGRGLTVLSKDDYRIRGSKLIYSTMAGRVASDGVSGSRNSPFAQAFISNIMNAEIFDDVFLDIANDTLRLTNGEQEPYALGSFAVKSYSLNPSAVPDTSVVTTRVKSFIPPYQKKPPSFILDGKKVFGFSVSPLFYPSTFSGDGFRGGGNLTFTFYEKYGNYGDFFFIPNSFFVSADLFREAHDVTPILKSNESLNDGQEVYTGGIIGIGSLWKIRIGPTQKFVASFGFSFEFFVGSAELYHDKALAENKLLYSHSMTFDPGMGLRGGLSFRFTPLISLDFGIFWKFSFITRDINIPVIYDYDPFDGTPSKYTDYFAKDLRPYTLGVCLGISFWWPR